MKKYLSLLTTAMPNKSVKVTFEALYRELDNKDVSFEAFKVDLIDYMKKKVKKFTIKNNVLSVECYTKCEINELVKYYKIGTETKQIDMDLLYNSWTNPFDANRNIFVNKLEKYLVAKEFNYFIFDNALHIKE